MTDFKFPLPRHDAFLIGGAWVAPRGGETHTLVNPADETRIADIPMADEAEVNAAVAAATAAFDSWAQTPLAERRRLLVRLLDLYNGAYEELAELMTREMGTVRSFSSSAQSWVGQQHLEATLRAMDGFVWEESRGDMRLIREPVGVCALITPWNWPMNQLVVKVAPALAAGCTMVAKPSEFSPLSSLRFAELVVEAGIPPGVYNHITGSGPVAGSALSRHPDVAMVSITGSTRAGIAVARDAAETVKRVHQELGGKSANIILPDADLRARVIEGVETCFSNCGQACKAPARMLVPHDRMDEAADIARAHVETIRVGNPMDAETGQGPVVNALQYDRIQDLIQAGIDQEGGSARLVIGGTGRPDGLNSGYYIRPTVFSHTDPKSRIATEEIFGPVLTIIGYEDEDEAIRIANDTVYGLSGYVQSADTERARRVARRLRCGTVFINNADWTADMPFGGYGQSGNGREHGEFGLADFTELKAVLGHG